MYRTCERRYKQPWTVHIQCLPSTFNLSSCRSKKQRVCFHACYREDNGLHYQAVQVGSSRVEGETISKPYLTGGLCGDDGLDDRDGHDGHYG